MVPDKDDFLRELLNDFKDEAEEHLYTIEDGIIELENASGPLDNNVLETIYREVHTLKGAARAVNLQDTEQLCMAIEGVMSNYRDSKDTLPKPLMEILHKAVDFIRVMISDIKITGTEKKVPAISQIISSLNNIQHTLEMGSQPDQDIIIPETKASDSYISELESDTIRISTSRLKQILSESEDYLSIKTSLAYYLDELEVISKKCKDQRLTLMYEDFIKFTFSANRMIDDLINNVRDTLLIPFSTILNYIPRTIRDLANQSGKKIKLEISGEHYQIDKRILEELKDPLLHIIRNCIDHGIETPKKRVSLKKDSVGTISILISKEENSNLSVKIQDDGEGIDVDSIVKSAIKNKVITSDIAEALSKEDKINLLFSSGVSTSDIVTEISGRGLGMAIVAEKIKYLGGSIIINSEEGTGTSFIITLPQTIATNRGLAVICSGKTFLIPTNNIDKVVGVSEKEITLSGNKMSLFHDREHIGLLNLSSQLGLKTNVKTNNEWRPTLILKSGNIKMAYMVDEILDEVDSIVKPLGRQLKNIPKISGVAYIKNGLLVPVINVANLIDGSASFAHSDIQNLVSTIGSATEKQKLLIVEDSITIRNMLKTIIETAGYDTEVAIDGMDAFNKLQNEEFDAVVTDIEMPNMDGFELTSKIREDKRFSEMPVILITALESSKDMRRGAEVGANAYIVKGSFEKSNLIETIKRLI